MGGMKATCKTIRAVSWEAAIQEAQDFIKTLSAEQLLSISHVSESPYAVIFVWYAAE